MTGSDQILSVTGKAEGIDHSDVAVERTARSARTPIPQLDHSIGPSASNQATVGGKLQRMQWRSLRKLDTLLGNRQTRFKRPQANGAIPAPGRGPLTIGGNSHQIYAMAMTAKRPQLGPIGHVPQAHGLIETT